MRYEFRGGERAFAENVTYGNANTAIGDNNVLVGNINMALVGDNSTVVGSNNSSNASDSIAVGTNNNLGGQYTVSIGHYNKASAAKTITVGYYAEANFESGVAIGANAKAMAKDSVAVGSASEANEENTFSIGSMFNQRRIVNVADGTNNTDGATYGQIIKAGDYTITLGTDGKGQVTLKTNAGANGPTIQVDASALAGGAGVAFDGDKLNTDIQNTDVAGGYKGTATNPNVDTKGTVAGAINSAYQAGKEYTDTQLTDKVGIIAGGTYVEADKNVAENLGKLDTQVKANADAINTKADKDLSNITDAGKNVIKDLAGNKAGEVVDAKLGDITSENYVKKADTVNANISALDKQMKANTDNIGDTSKLTTAGLGSNLSDAVVNVNNKVGTADELKALKDAGLGDNLAQATAAVNKKADKNAEDIKTVNGRVDELGGRVDTLGGAVSKLDTKVNKVGAGAAALAALHPMDFDPDNKLSFAAGVGSYHGASAVAIGAFYRPSEQVMFSISGNMGNGENMVNAGVSFALDRPSKTPTTKAALVKTVAAQNEQIAALKETVAEQNEKIARLEAMVEKLAAKQNASY